MAGMFEGKLERSDEILLKAEKEDRGLTTSERNELREAYAYEQAEKKKNSSTLQEGIKNFKEEAQVFPRHMTNCPSFKECPLDFKCRNYNSAYLECQNCILHNTDQICHKRELHNEKNIAMMIKRPRIEIGE